jgi:hypothetical protein
MGSQFTAICKKCGHRFEANVGGGFSFHLLHCDECGRNKSIGFNEIGEAHLRYLKGLGGPYCIATQESDEFVQKNYPGDSISEEDYHRICEELAGKCKCGGRFKLDAPPRCPKCRSDEFKSSGDGLLLYD